MTSPFTLALQGVSFQLPSGEPLLSDLDETFDERRTALVGRNGVGKSVLARIIVGELQPAAGRVLRSGPVHYLPQRIEPQAYRSVADLAGVQPLLEALARVEVGGVDPADFELLDGHWDLRARLEAELAAAGLAHLMPDTPAATLSGGECTRVALLGAWFSEADWLVLDEPSNHLDRAGREALREQLQRWRGGLILISHDRLLLDDMQRIVELSSTGLRSYAGGYAFYREVRQQEQDTAQRELQRRKLQRDRQQHAMQEQRERQEHRQAKGRQEAKTANQAKILVDRQKERSQTSIARLATQHGERREQLSRGVQEAFAQLRDDPAIHLNAPACALPEQRGVLLLEALRLPFGNAAALDLQLVGPRRVAISGRNGSGKSTLLKVIAGQLGPVAGSCEVKVRSAYLDQHLEGLLPECSVLQLLHRRNPVAEQSVLRTRLAQLGLPATRIELPSALLSGGERLKAALACELYAQQPAQLLLLDEPDNHLDLPSREALEELLRQYRGALLVVSHDEAFLARLALEARLECARDGWRWSLA
ncbi:ATPase subunit of ABC transporter with duplicated ATPase domains [Pseudomonas nitritireducens]|uniref:ATPase subunit of ABC transporter with duplicated ATPase domains n=1 Tax=Pseudomonas nitroreducens TaxID=46680 RepID=A0A7W7P0S6_PSENT|nr:ABC-F family ATP-binding cassette domain-containing protein [Pseudomonas nitritireducens]MBB4863766.1 ATPase subunit of ABC transporter with duplicated ATPase domains [Pseudomonas nitritireducens]